MFTRSDLSDLMGVDSPVGVSIFLTTHVTGDDIRQDPIRLKNLATQARDRLLATGMRSPEVEALLAPAVALVEDGLFWQHQDRGLALFLDGGEPRHFKVPIPLTEQVVVGPGFHVKPLLPLLAADGAFFVLTLTADKVSLFNASRFALVQDRSADLPGSLEEVAAESDYQNPVQASPVARPNTGNLSIGNAQVYGDSPPDWRKEQLVEFSQRVASSAEALLSANPLPVVLVADAELGGHFRKASKLGPLLAGVIEINPEALDSAQLHEAAYAIVRPRFDDARHDAVERFTALRNKGDERAATEIDDVVKAAYRGQVDTLLLRVDDTVWGHYDRAADQVSQGESFTGTGEDLVDRAAVQTLEHGGKVHVLSPDDLADAPPAAAILRYR